MDTNLLKLIALFPFRTEVFLDQRIIRSQMPRGQSAKKNPRELHLEIETTRALSHCSTNQSTVTQTHTATGNKAKTKQKHRDANF